MIKNYDVISFDTDDILSLNSIINIYSMAIIIRSVFKDNNKFYPQIYLTDCMYNEKNGVFNLMKNSIIIDKKGVL